MVILLKIQTKIRRDLWIFGVRPLNMGGLNKKNQSGENYQKSQLLILIRSLLSPQCRQSAAHGACFNI